MKIVNINENSSVAVKEVEEPRIKETDVLISLNGCGICGTDKENIEGNSSMSSTKLGHEICGTIIKRGEKVDKRYSEGMRVFVHHHASCGNCHFCRHGNHTMCDRYCDDLEPCGMSEKFILPGWNIEKGSLFPLPDSISDEEGVLIEPLACCVRAWKKINRVKNDSCVIFGMGTIGIMHALLAKNFKFNQIFCIDIKKEKIDLCEDMNLGYGISSQKEDFEIIKRKMNQGVDLVIIAISNMEVLKQAIELVRKGGTILIFGQPKKNSFCDIDMSDIYSKEISIHTTYAASNEDVKESISLIKDGSLNINKLVTHKFSIDKSVEAFQCAIENNKAIKVVITGSK